ncbi:hypothetical protein D3C87_1793520 [compost metagenome]
MLIYFHPRKIKINTITTLIATIKPLTKADSLVPLIKTKDISTMINTAGKLNIP